MDNKTPQSNNERTETRDILSDIIKTHTGFDLYGNKYKPGQIRLPGYKASPQIPKSVQNVEQWPSKEMPAESFEQMQREGWATLEQQRQYWKDRDANLDKTESACAWFDEKDQRDPFS